MSIFLCKGEYIFPISYDCHCLLKYDDQLTKTVEEHDDMTWKNADLDQDRQ